MKITWEFVEDEYPWEPEDPMGKIYITDGSSAIIDEFTFLDCWFSVLVEGAKLLKEDGVVEMRVWCEPYSLKLEIQNNDVVLSCQGSKVIADSLLNFYNAVSTSTQDFVKQMKSFKLSNEYRKSLIELEEDVQKFQRELN